MQKFFDLLATKFAEAIQLGFTLAADRMEAMDARLAHVEQETPRIGKAKEQVNGRK